MELTQAKLKYLIDTMGMYSFSIQLKVTVHKAKSYLKGMPDVLSKPQISRINKQFDDFVVMYIGRKITEMERGAMATMLAPYLEESSIKNFDDEDLEDFKGGHYRTGAQIRRHDRYGNL